MDWTDIDLTNIFCSLTHFSVFCPASTFLSSHTIEHDSFRIVVSCDFTHLQNCWHGLMHGATPAHSSTRRAEFIPTLCGIHMALCFFKLERWPMLFRPLYCLKSCLEFHSCIAKNNIKAVRCQRL